MKHSLELRSYSFTDSDIDLITFAVRRIAEKAVFRQSKIEATELLKYIERLKKEHKSSSIKT